MAACSSKTLVIFYNNCSIYPAPSIANPHDLFIHPHNKGDDHNANKFSNYCRVWWCTLRQFLVSIFLCEQHYMLYSLKCCKMLHIYLATEVYFLFNKMFIVASFNIALCVWLLLTFIGEKVKWPRLYLGTEFNRSVKWRVNLFCTLCVDSGSTAQHCTALH